jgi:FixJ family two-component response regulator
MPRAIPFKGLETDMMAQPTVVIVVDDDPSILKSMARLLAHHGIDSRTFASAEALVESDCLETATCLLLDLISGEFRELNCSAGLWHQDRGGPLSS